MTATVIEQDVTEQPTDPDDIEECLFHKDGTPPTHCQVIAAWMVGWLCGNCTKGIHKGAMCTPCKDDFVAAITSPTCRPGFRLVEVVAL